jgi:hypothetical protein
VSAAVDRPLGDHSLVGVLLEVRGARPVPELAARIGDLSGVHHVHAGDANEMFD